MRLPGLLSGCLLVAAALAWPDRAEAVQRVAVLILPGSDADSELADNLTEIVIARIAERQQTELADKAEFHRRLGLESDQRAQGCIEDVTCLGRVGVVLGVNRVVSGSVSTAEKGHLISMVLTHIESGDVESRFFRLVPGDVGALIEAVQEGTDALFRPKAAPGRVHVRTNPAGARVTIDERFVGTAPVFSPPLHAGPHQLRVEMDRRLPWTSAIEVIPGTDLQIELDSDQFKRPRTWPTRLAYGTLAGAALTLTTGVIFGALSQREATGMTRVGIQSEINDRRQLATTANILYVATAVLVAVSGITFASLSDEILD